MTCTEDTDFGAKLEGNTEDKTSTGAKLYPCTHAQTRQAFIREYDGDLLKTTTIKHHIFIFDFFVAVEYLRYLVYNYGCSH